MNKLESEIDLLIIDFEAELPAADLLHGKGSYFMGLLKRINMDYYMYYPIDLNDVMAIIKAFDTYTCLCYRFNKIPTLKGFEMLTNVTEKELKKMAKSSYYHVDRSTSDLVDYAPKNHVQEINDRSNHFNPDNGILKQYNTIDNKPVFIDSFDCQCAEEIERDYTPNVNLANDNVNSESEIFLNNQNDSTINDIPRDSIHNDYIPRNSNDNNYMDMIPNDSNYNRQNDNNINNNKPNDMNHNSTIYNNIENIPSISNNDLPYTNPNHSNNYRFLNHSIPNDSTNSNLNDSKLMDSNVTLRHLGRPAFSHSQLLEKFLNEIEAALQDSVASNSSIGSIFLLKSKFGYRENETIKGDDTGEKAKTIEQIRQERIHVQPRQSLPDFEL